MSRIRLRSRFLLVRMVIAAALTAAVILVVRYAFLRETNRQITEELQQCSERLRLFQEQNETLLSQSAEMLASSPAVAALLAEPRSDAGKPWPPTQELAARVDLLALGDAKTGVIAMKGASGDVERKEIARLLETRGEETTGKTFWTIGERLYRVHLREIPAPQTVGRTAAVLLVGTEMGALWTAQAAAVCSCDVALTQNGSLLASTLNPEHQQELLPQLPKPGAQSAAPLNLKVGTERFRANVMTVAAEGGSPILVVLKSSQGARQQLADFTKLMALLAVAAMVVGFFLVVRLSDTFAKPLGNLVEAVRALEKGDFSYPVLTGSDDELAEVTQAFDQMRSSLQETQKQLLKNERLATIGQMASSISHDLRHPLTAIVANSEFLSEGKLTAEQRQGLHEEIRVAVEQMNDLIESLLEFSRGRDSPRLVKVHLEEIVERAVRSLKTRPEFQAIAVKVDCAEPVECFVDPLKIERALRNLLINACEAAPQDSGEVEVSVTASDGAVEVRVADNGPGVPNEIRETLFQPFVSYGKASGTGLGLAVVQKICQDHDGEAALESSEPGRTVFLMAFPLMQQEE